MCRSSRVRLLANAVAIPSLCLAALLVSAVQASEPRGNNDGAAAIRELKSWLTQPTQERQPVEELKFARISLNRREAEAVTEMLLEDHARRMQAEAAESFRKGEIVAGGVTMKFAYKRFGEPRANGKHSLYISMHGGGGAPPQVNDQQWENQKRLYEPEEGIYVAPRAPGDTWDLWHQGHIDPCFDALIAQMIVFENVDPNRVYLMGYSAGGDGVYQLAPRMADRFAAASMMAGHPNESSPLGLRNLPFAIYCGGKDTAYGRNEVCAAWGKQLDELQTKDADGYPHRTTIYPDKGHWMDRLDAEAVPWMATLERRTRPDRIIWNQDDVIGTRFYWLSMAREAGEGRPVVDVKHNGNQFEINKASKELELSVRLDDSMVDFDKPIVVKQGDQTLFAGIVERTIATLAKTLAERGDPTGIYAAEIHVKVTATP